MRCKKDFEFFVTKHWLVIMDRQAACGTKYWENILSCLFGKGLG